RARTLNGAAAAGCPKSSLPSQARDWERPALRGRGGAFLPPRTPAARCRTTSPFELRIDTSTSVEAEPAKSIWTCPPCFFAEGAEENSCAFRSEEQASSRPQVQTPRMASPQPLAGNL